MYGGTEVLFRSALGSGNTAAASCTHAVPEGPVCRIDCPTRRWVAERWLRLDALSLCVEACNLTYRRHCHSLSLDLAGLSAALYSLYVPPLWFLRSSASWAVLPASADSSFAA